MADKFELLLPGSACEAVLPVNTIRDDYSITRLVPLVTTANGVTQSMVLPRDVVHPEFAKAVSRRLPDLPLEKVKGGQALIPEWNAAIKPETASPDEKDTTKISVPPSVVEGLLPNYEFALHLPYVQTWELLGYSRGALLNSISLAPQEESTIEIFSWERVKRTREESLSEEQESTQEVTFTDKDSREVLKELTRDTSFTFHAGLELQVPVEGVTIGGGVSADTKDALRDFSRATQQMVNEVVRKASARTKTSRQTKVTESEEFGSETKVARKLRNPNMCHTLNIDHFEILANYRVTTTLLLDQVRLCVLVQIPVADAAMQVSREFLLSHEGALRRALLSPVYAKGFDAARLLATWQRLCEVKCAPPCPCQVPAGVPPTGNPAVDAARAQVENAAGMVAAAIKKVNEATPKDLCDLACLRTSGDEAAWTAAKLLYHQWLYGRLMDLIASRWWATALQFSQDTDRSPEAAEQLLLAANAQPADIFNLALLPVRFWAEALVIANSLLAQGCWNLWVMSTNIGFDDAGLNSTLTRLRAAVAAYHAAIEAAQNPPPGNQPVEADTSPPEFPPKDLASALVDEAALLAHVHDNAAYYQYVIWQALDPSDRTTALAGQGALLSFLGDEVLGHVSTKIALPFRLGSNPDVAAWFQGNVLDNDGLKETPQPFAITLPTPGVMTETRLGQCNGCEEFIGRHRELDLQQKTAEVALAQYRAELEKSEAQRYQMRLAQKPPVLEDPDTSRDIGAIRIILQDDKPKTPAEPAK